MNKLLKHELARLESILRGFGFALEPAQGASQTKIAQAEQVAGIRLDEALVDFYRFSNGSNGRSWLAVMTDEVTRCTFPSIEKALSWWQEWIPYDENHYKYWQEQDEPRDSRIQPAWLKHRKWFGIAEANCWGTTVYFDTDPTPDGTYGQIIVYQHDPDAMYFVAPTFLDFLRKSNDLMSENGEEILFCDGTPVF